VEQKVIPASPTTLIALLRAVAYGWKQERIAENAQRIHDLGRELHERIGVLAAHFAAMGRGLGSAVDSYNQALASMETRLMVTARQFQELGAASSKETPRLESISQAPRTDRSAGSHASGLEPRAPQHDGVERS
jgi:DNA recombination protein RmuC